MKICPMESVMSMRETRTVGRTDSHDGS